MKTMRWVLASLLAVVMSTAAVDRAVGQCTIDFSACPDVNPQCDATFTGGFGCWTQCGFPGYFMFGAEVAPPPVPPMIITIPIGIGGIDVRLEAEAGPLGFTMRFFDAVSGGSEVGSPITSVPAGDFLPFCGDSPIQSQTFTVAVHRIEVRPTDPLTLTGTIRAMTLYAVTTPVEETTWGRIKALYT